MTLEEFRATGRDADASEIAEAQGVDVRDTSMVGGRIYAHNLCIEHSATVDEWYLITERSEHTGSLADMEALLYDFAVLCGYFSA